ncbi:hypothetical protein BDV95DRAFT_558493 [Massariosphaeria phaeospora]|uniref:Rhodopsin domain-containing protein n=1 Tax=Massariosphaeria phaeospora TaxID=100035 RepID=A0A7C8IIB4_9PLEO|nr:hypothetical protein BDV95DRAFT_558493 [Massariosphaeria phaeospora]
MSLKDELDKIPPDMLDKLPILAPPPGVQSNFIDAPNVSGKILAVLTCLFVIMLGFSMIRIYVAIQIKRKMDPDDWMTAAAAVGVCLYYILACLLIRLKVGWHGWDISVAEVLDDRYSVRTSLATGPPNFVWPLPKTIFLLMYLRLFRLLTWLRWCAITGIVVIWIWYYVTGIILIAYTAPMHGQSWRDAVLSPRRQKAFDLTIPNGCFGLVADIFILALPLIAISHLHLTKRRKLAVAAMFSTGGICCIASSVTLYFQHVLKKFPTDSTYWLSFILLSYMTETCVGISTACMPSLARLCRHHNIDIGSIISRVSFPRKARTAPMAADSQRPPTFGSPAVRRPWSSIVDAEGNASHSMENIVQAPSEATLVKKPSYEPAHHGNVHMENFDYRGQL